MRSLIYVLIGFISLLCSCGTSTEVEGFAIEGKVVYENGTPVDGATVRIRSANYLAFYPDKFIAPDTITDDNGRFFFDTLPGDSYVVEINKKGLYGTLQRFTINSTDTFPIVLPTGTLVPTGALRGNVNFPVANDSIHPLVALYSVEYMKTVPVTQDFTFEGVPAGTYSLMIIPYSKSKFLMIYSDIEVVSDSMNDLGILNLKIPEFYCGCTNAACDSIAVRSILDANGLFRTNVNSVSTVDSLTKRIFKLDLSHLELSTLTQKIGTISELRTLNVRANKIVEIPSSVQYLLNLQECFVDSNNISELPYELTYLKKLRVLTVRNNNLSCINAEILALNLFKLDLRDNMLIRLSDAGYFFTGIKYLYLDNNQLEILPEIPFLINPIEFTFKNNRLCNISEKLDRYLSSYDNAWHESQNCTGD